MKISIITLTFNSARTIKRNALSVVNQTYKDFEHIIVDNLSSDETLKYLRNVYESSSCSDKLKIISEKDNGISEAFNKGIEKAEGELIGILNSDDCFYDDEVLAKAVKKFNDKNILFVHGNIYFDDIKYGSNIRRPLLCKVTTAMPYNHPTMFFRKEVYQNYGGFDRNYKYAMDFEFICRLTKSIKDFNERGFYISGSPLVRMFAGGVSWSNEVKAIEETRTALILHNLWDLNASRSYLFKMLRTRFKLLLSKMGMESIVVRWRQNKWKNKNKPEMKSFDKICNVFPDIEGMIFISESKEDPSRKTYLLNDVVIKSRDLEYDISAHLRQNDLHSEYEILNMCKSVKGVPDVLHYFKNEKNELLLLRFVKGIQLCNLQLTLFQHLTITINLATILVKLSKRGISHNDITPQNVLIDEKLQVSIIDFDQATKTKVLSAFLRQFFGFNIGESKVNYSIFTIIKDYLRKKFPKVVYRTKKLFGVKYPDYEELPELTVGAEPKVNQLLEAWKIAQISNASSPGLPIAYYSLEFSGTRFPGERPWIKRWNELKNISEYKDKKILELGCNMGLLSTFLLKETGAANCTGVDHDKKILEAAKIISEVYDVDPTFLKVDFDSKKDWENELLSTGADIVFALNVLNWVKNKDRFLNFLGKFAEVIFEGHDLPDVEEQRFKNLGFSSIEQIGFSERERIILRCRK